MKVYQGTDIRNIALVGHAHSGKTSLASALLFTAGATPRLGRVDEGTTVTDYDEEEVARQMTVSTGVAHLEWGKSKVNLLDTPGFNMFVHEAKAAMVAAECAMVTVDGVSGIEVITERVWGYDEVGDSGLVKTHIRHLRQKVEPEANNPQYIMTVPGVGYTFAAPITIES